MVKKSSMPSVRRDTQQAAMQNALLTGYIIECFNDAVSVINITGTTCLHDVGICSGIGADVYINLI